MTNTWTSRSAAQAITWKAVAWNGTVWCAVANTGTNRCMTSSDGITWTTRTPATDSDWRSIAWNGTVFCAVGVGGLNVQPPVMTSPDGITWTSRTAPFTTDPDLSYFMTDIAWNGTVFCAVGYSDFGGGFNDGECMTSSDGITWTNRTGFGTASTGITTKRDIRLAWCSGASKFIAVPKNGGTSLVTSADGATWTQRTCQDLGLDSDTLDVAGNASVAVIVGDFGVQSSTDGITWTSRTEAAANDWNAVEWNGSQFAAVSITGVGDRVMVSADGITWTSETSAADNTWEGIESNGALRWAAVASDGTDQVMTGDSPNQPIALCGFLAATL